jgi:tagatose 6-phosphate kinase
VIICLSTTPALARSMIFKQLKIDDVNRALDVKQATAGKNNNAARVLTTLGEDAIATGFLGGDTGQAIRRDLDAAGVRHDYVEVDSPTRLCVTVIDRASSHATELVQEAGPVTPAEVEALLEKLKALVGQAFLPATGRGTPRPVRPGEYAQPWQRGMSAPPILLLSGSLAPGVPVDFYRRCVEIASAAGWLSIVDAAGEPLTRSLAAKPFLVKPNRSELARTVGRPVETDDQLHAAIRELIGLGPAWVVVTMGAAGAVVSDGESFVRWKSPTINPVSAIGSGDAFAAGLAAGIVREQSVPDAARLGIACGAANALTDLAGHLSLADVQRLLPQVERVT